jgi:hypothetical protein
VVAVIRVHAKLIDNFERVLAPVFDVDQAVVERSSVVPLEAVVGAKCSSCPEYIWSDNLFEQTLKLGIRKPHSV